MRIVQVGNVIMIAEWEKGDILQGVCCECGRDVEFLLKYENKETDLRIETLKCDCGEKHQIFY